MTGVYQPGRLPTPERDGSEDVAAEVLVAHQVAEPLTHVGGIDDHCRSGELLSAEGDILEHLLHDGEQPARAEVLILLVDAIRLSRELADPILGEVEGHALGAEQRRVLPGQRVARLGEDSYEIILAERLQFDADRKATLELRDEVAGTGGREGAGS